MTQRKMWGLVAGLAVVLAGSGAAVAVTRHRADPAPPPAAPAAATTAIERRDLATTKSLDGSIGFGTARPFAGHREATVTWLPAPGTKIKRGRQLYRANDLPVPLFYGSMPLYRPITGKGLTGRDVRIVVDNLRALGYPTGPVAGEEAELTPALIDAVKRWQKDTGLPESGAIQVGDVEVLAGAVRVEAVTVQPGVPADGELMSVTSTRKVVTVPAELSQASSIERGQKVTVVLPDERRVPGKVLSVGRTVAPPEGADSPKLNITVVVDQPKRIAEIDSADVRVEFSGEIHEDVLAVPVEALVALAEGGYALQLPGGALVAVETGMFASGWVEITGDGLDEGTAVVVPG
ncbi:HlyD family efflux transporter periplasmic adaptor subunit [Actinoplanes sp. G11-F43]|uniref:HlyD family efflux transporter periplasmic adaptor subunit n=1 Tax=Actinoplanes sp. G11-F43 TaxID=3424130 RepID=UPI003D358086